MNDLINQYFIPNIMILNLEIQLLPIGDVNPEILNKLASKLEDVFQRVEILRPIPLKRSAYNSNRDQYLSDAFLRKIKRMTDGRALGVTEVDLYTYDLDFVFGQAEMPGYAAVISLNRLHNKSQELFHSRMLKEALHELGHTLGLHHCKDVDCVMHFSNSLEDTDIKKETFCERCEKLLIE